jgi:hypothetical protein
MRKLFEGYKMKEILNEIIKRMINENNPEFRENILNLISKNINVGCLKILDVYDKIYEVIISDETFLSKYHWTKNYAKLKLVGIINANFKKIYFEEISKDSQKKVKDIIFINSNFINYFHFTGNDKYEYEKNIAKYQEKMRETKVSEILKYISKNKNKKIIKKYLLCAYESLNENKILLLSFFFLQKKMKEKNFMDNLEKNYGVCVDIDIINKEIKEKLKEIKTYKQLFEYVGSEFGKNEDEIYNIKNVYEKAIEIGL